MQPCDAAYSVEEELLDCREDLDEAQTSACELHDMQLCSLPFALLDHILDLAALESLAAVACVSRDFRLLAERALARRTEASAADLLRLPHLHNYLLLGDEPAGAPAGSRGYGAGSASWRGMQSYLPRALHHLSRHCRGLRALRLELPAPPAPHSPAVAAAAHADAWEPWGPAPHLIDAQCPPVDGYLIKVLAQCCPQLRCLRLVNLHNNRAVARVCRLNDACLAVLGRHCPQLQELWLGNRGGEESVLSLAMDPTAPPATAYYVEEVTDAGLMTLARGCPGLRSLGLLRCSRVGDVGLGVVALLCRGLTELVLHDCPGASDRALMEVAEKCALLRRLDVVSARRPAPPPALALQVVGAGVAEEQLGFRALFTVAANCPLLEELAVSEEGLDAPAVDDDCLLCLGQGCRGLRRLALRHCAAVTDSGMLSLSTRCKQLEELVLEHTAVGDAGVLAISRGCPQLSKLHITSYTSSLSHYVLTATTEASSLRGISDASLRHIADHCRRLIDLRITGCRQVTDAGLASLAAARHPGFHAQLTSLALNHIAGTDAGVRCLLQRCTGLRVLGLRGLLFNADATMLCAALHCRHLHTVDLRHCSTLSDAGLAWLADCAGLERLHASFCPRLTDAGVARLAAKRGAGLRELDLYHAVQVGPPALRALAASCPSLERLNLGRCPRLEASALRRLLDTSVGGAGAGHGGSYCGVRLATCHYLDDSV